MKTAQKMIKTVAVYSTVDRNAPHVKFADEAVCIGEALQSIYLLGSKIEVKSLNVDAIHPGYGFLVDFAEENEIIFYWTKVEQLRLWEVNWRPKMPLSASIFNGSRIRPGNNGCRKSKSYC
jgi:propionyl-CoA carboxylase alpha chain